MFIHFNAYFIIFFKLISLVHLNAYYIKFSPLISWTHFDSYGVINGKSILIFKPIIYYTSYGSSILFFNLNILYDLLRFIHVIFQSLYALYIIFQSHQTLGLFMGHLYIYLIRIFHHLWLRNTINHFKTIIMSFLTLFCHSLIQNIFHTIFSTLTLPINSKINIQLILLKSTIPIHVTN